MLLVIFSENAKKLCHSASAWKKEKINLFFHLLVDNNGVALGVHKGVMNPLVLCLSGQNFRPSAMKNS